MQDIPAVEPGATPPKANSPLAEFVGIGGNYLLFRPDNHAVALLNKHGSEISRELLAGVSTREVASKLSARDGLFSEQSHAFVNSIFAQLCSGGFLDPSLSGRERISPRLELKAFEFPSRGQTYQVRHGRCVRLVCEDGRLAKLLDATLQPMVTGPDTAHQFEVVVTFNLGTYDVWRDRVAIAQDLDLATARRIALQTMLMALLVPKDVGVILHASAVSLENQAVILVGSTGSGKTTLMMGLVGRGARYLADDLTPIDTAGVYASGFPVAASVKSGSWDVVGRYFRELAHCKTHKVGERAVRYLDPVSEDTACEGRTKVGAIVFPKFRAGSSLQATRISAEDALSRILQSGSQVVGENRSIKPLARLVNETPALQLDFSDLDEARAVIIGTLNQS